MKNILLLFSGILLLSACKKDEEAPFVPLSVNETQFDITEARVVDYGAQNGHYNYDLYLVNGSLQEDNAPAADARLYVFAELFSPGTDAFKTGTFHYNTGPLAGQGYFETLVVAVDSNGDGKITEADDIIPATGGQVQVEGSSHNYTLTFNIYLLNGSKLKGMYRGQFDYQNKR